MIKMRFIQFVVIVCLLMAFAPPPMMGAEPVAYDPHDFEAMIEHFRESHEVDGSGITIAVIDTGIDPGLVELKGQHRLRLLSWVDFTDEGLVKTSHTARSDGNFLILEDGQRVRLGARRSRSGLYYYGWLSESAFSQDSGFQGDFDGNGSSRDRFLVVVVDSLRPGVYDTVYVDTHGSLTLADETALFAYSRLREHVTFPPGTLRPGVSMVVAEIQPQGRHVKLGFDGHGHGTQVASIAAASASESGLGVAPGVRLMSLKALTSDGYGTWSHLRAALQYAAENGADIALVSATGMRGGGTGEEGRLMDRLSQEYGTLFILVAGNDGPGLGTISSNLASEHALIVGAYATPELLDEFFAMDIPRTIVMPYSGVGPAGRLLPGPSVVAPAVAEALMPAWHELCHAVIDGTSVAAPYVAGGAALLMEALRQQGISATAIDLRRALVYGATPIRNYDALEQGFGVPDVARALDILKSGGISPHYLSISSDSWTGGHFNVRRQRPAETVLQLESGSDGSFYVSASGEREVRPQELLLTPAIERSLRLETEERLYPGRLASERVDLMDQSGALIDSAFISHVNPHRGGGMVWDSTLEAGLRDRKFIAVEEGTTLMVVKVAFPPDRDDLQGMGEVFIYDPAGNLAAHSGWLGAGQSQSEQYMMLTMPAPGVYEIVVVMDVRTGLETPRARVSLSVELEGYELAPLDTMEAGYHSLGLSRVGATTTAGLDVVDELGVSPVMLTVRKHSTVFRSLSTVPAGLDELIVRTGHPTVIGADLNLYLYHFNPTDRRWTEIAASATPGMAEEWIIIQDPPAGNYLAYIDAVDLKGAAEISFRFEEHLHKRLPIAVDPDQIELARRQRTNVHMSYPQMAIPRNPQLRITEESHAIFATLVSIPTRASGNLLVNLEQGVRLDGQKSSALLTVLCAENLQAVDVSAVVNGRLYPVEGGRAVIDILDDERQLVVRLLGERFESVLELTYPVQRQVTITHDYLEDGDAYRRFISQLRDE